MGADLFHHDIPGDAGADRGRQHLFDRGKRDHGTRDSVADPDHAVGGVELRDEPGLRLLERRNGVSDLGMRASFVRSSRLDEPLIAHAAHLPSAPGPPPPAPSRARRRRRRASIPSESLPRQYAPGAGARRGGGRLHEAGGEEEVAALHGLDVRHQHHQRRARRPQVAPRHVKRALAPPPAAGERAGGPATFPAARLPLACGSVKGGGPAGCGYAPGREIAARTMMAGEGMHAEKAAFAAGMR